MSGIRFRIEKPEGEITTWGFAPWIIRYARELIFFVRFIGFPDYAFRTRSRWLEQNDEHWRKRMAKRNEECLRLQRMSAKSWRDGYEAGWKALVKEAQEQLS